MAHTGEIVPTEKSNYQVWIKYYSVDQSINSLGINTMLKGSVWLDIVVKLKGQCCREIFQKQFQNYKTFVRSTVQLLSKNATSILKILRRSPPSRLCRPVCRYLMRFIKKFSTLHHCTFSSTNMCSQTLPLIIQSQFRLDHKKMYKKEPIIVK